MLGFYTALTFLLTCLGSISGMGGGVVLKPVMDLMGGHDATQTGVLTATSVFIMSLVSVARGFGERGQFRPAGALALGLGAVAGGVLGQALLRHLVSTDAGDAFTKLCQNAVLGSVELCVLAYAFMKNARRLGLRHGAFYLAAGVSLGVFSAFLGIGGGAVNVALLMFLFNMDIKRAAAHSLLVILFSQAAKLLSILAAEGFQAFNLAPLLPCMAAAAVAGSLLGAALTRKLSQRAVLCVFGAMLAAVLCATGYNIVKFSGTYFAGNEKSILDPPTMKGTTPYESNEEK